jgi:hypothetical protein
MMGDRGAINYEHLPTPLKIQMPPSKSVDFIEGGIFSMQL